MQKVNNVILFAHPLKLLLIAKIFTFIVIFKVIMATGNFHTKKQSTNSRCQRDEDNLFQRNFIFQVQF